jgi:hypothetical protein
MSLPSLSSSTTAATTLSNATTSASALGNLILATPNPSQTQGYQPQNPPNGDGTPSTTQPPPAFLFNYEGEQSVVLDSDITDHYIEDNTAIQDQIALKPVTITTQGFVSELNNVVPAILQPLQLIANTLTTVGAYAPGLSVTAVEDYNEAFQLYQVAQNAKTAGVSAWSSVTGGQGTTVINGQESAFSPLNRLSNQNKQQTAFQLFYGYWINRTLFTVQTPWAIFQNMAIKTLRPVQSADSNTYTTFECTFKQIRTASSSTPSQSLVSQGRLSMQASDITNQGTSTPTNSLSIGSGLSGPTSASFPGSFPTATA